jgi:hypothetical protein
MRHEQEPVESIDKFDRRKTYDHPAFGQIGASRVQGGGFALYGSDFRHDATIEIRIHRSQLQRDLSRDWHFERDEIVSVRLSEAQWATFISSLNNGSGVTCTIHAVERERMPDIARRTERDVVNREFEERVERIAKHIGDAISDMESAMDGLSKAKREKLLERMRRAHKEVYDSMPFAAKCFAEHVEDTVEKAKIEVEAYIHARMMRAGLKALGAEPPKMIDNGD